MTAEETKPKLLENEINAYYCTRGQEIAITNNDRSARWFESRGWKVEKTTITINHKKWKQQINNLK